MWNILCDYFTVAHQFYFLPTGKLPIGNKQRLETILFFVEIAS